MSAADNHRIRSRRGYQKKVLTLAPKKTTIITPALPKKRRRISSLFFRRKSAS